MPGLPPECHKSLAVGQQAVSKGRQGSSALNKVQVMLCCIRLPQHGSDLLVTLNSPVFISDKSAAAEHAGKRRAGVCAGGTNRQRHAQILTVAEVPSLPAALRPKTSRSRACTVHLQPGPASMPLSARPVLAAPLLPPKTRLPLAALYQPPAGTPVPSRASRHHPFHVPPPLLQPAGAGFKGAHLTAPALFRQILASLRINDWGLFGAS